MIIEVYESVSILFQQLCTLSNTTSTKSTKGCGNNVLYKREKYKSVVNIFHRNIYRITTSLSIRCKTYCFAFQKRLFCTVKA
ncbi:hypothetical protein CLI71_06310 [Prevotella intermedia]|uniref:Uncharacterized protein n=1 Tax=Prevotella intermedia TaxID=28131 RepID=A0A2A6EFI5_PREIN|nr:hypothetical protein CLI71_06310 [Prevotella intermedia]